MITRYNFSDGYIEEDKTGCLTCIGNTAVEAGIILRKSGAKLDIFIKAFEMLVEKEKEKENLV